MAVNERYFVEWKEQYVSKERGNRVVHYFLKDNSGESILAVVGTERSVRHMFYVVAEEFLSARGADSSVQAGFRWRSRREVVNWLTSMLSKQHRRGDYATSHKDTLSSEVNTQQAQMPPHKGRIAKNLKGHHLGISWSGSSWACVKQLKHYPAFRRNGISIAVQSFVFVMAEKDNRYIAYLEDMYEDRKCQKKVKVRWFHHNQEVKGVVSLQNPHPKEVFITPYVQVISAECVDGPAIVLTSEHYEKCVAVFPHDLLGGVHFCFRQFKSSRTKPFKLSKLRGYFDQPIFSCFNPDFFDEKELSSEDDVKVGAKRSRSCREFNKSRYDLSYKKCGPPSHVEGQLRHTPGFTLNEKVEFLSQDSGLRGCWFRCTVLEVSKRQMKILYDDVKDDDSSTNLEGDDEADRLVRMYLSFFSLYKVITLAKSVNDGLFSSIVEAHPKDVARSIREYAASLGVTFPELLRRYVPDISSSPLHEWIPTFRLAKADKLGLRHVGRLTIRPAYTCKEKELNFEIGDPADAWWSDGENLYLNIELKNLRVSRDWVGDGWADVEPNRNILCIISGMNADDNSPISGPKFSAVEEEINDIAGMTLTNVPLKDEKYEVEDDVQN
ncbi:hypothetical protein PHJA_000190400 [Phtheirospermum japonicum]|uniref:BAH domain-containing protein n=1 Tax=Phtheirospermum japonicum TaxID=374723 RepID=A0A830AZK5_9LAMI|nr:hypothetical protein PHJA_000190400 [Phtheirospermum japonicum]